MFEPPTVIEEMYRFFRGGDKICIMLEVVAGLTEYFLSKL